MKRTIGAYMKVIPELFFLAVLVFLTYNALVNQFGFLHNVNLIFHEAGHTIFFFLGEFVSILGGSLMQILIPAVVTIVFLREARWYGVIFGLWWIGENFIDVSVYAADAKVRILPLLGGDAVIHDWWYLLTKLGLIEYAAVVGYVLWLIGAIIIGGSFALLLYIIHEKLPNDAVVH